MRPVRIRRPPKPKRPKSTEPADKWVKELIELRRTNPLKYERDTPPHVQALVEAYEDRMASGSAVDALGVK